MTEVASAISLRARYDPASDVLYLTTHPKVPARSREGQPGLVWRYDIHTDALIGLTVVDFAAYWGGARRDELVRLIAERFALPAKEARETLDGVS